MRRTDPDDAVLVELDEGDDAGAPEGDGTGPRDSHEPRRRRALWWTGLGVVVALVATVALVNVAEARREAARRAAFADLPWVLPALDGPLEEVWRVTGGWVMGETSAAILVSSVDGNGGIQGIDPGTGNVLWEIPLANGYCWPAADWNRPTSSPPSESSDLHDMVVCEQMAEPDENGTTTSTLATYDGVTGEHLATVTPQGAADLTSLLGGDYLTASSLDDGTVVVALTDLRSGTARWTYRSAPGEADRLFAGSWGVTYDDDVIYIDGAEDLALSRRTGEPVAATGAPPQQPELTLDDGGRVEVTYDPATGAVGGRVVDDGVARFRFDGWPWSGFGFADDTVLVVQQPDGEAPSPSSGTAVVGLDPATGTELWRRPESGWSNPLMALDGVAVMVSQTFATAIDLHTGAEEWSRPEDSVVYFPTPVTDGDVVLLADRANDQLELVAVDLHTGEDRWRMAAPSGLGSVSVSSDRLVLMSASGELIAYRP